MQHLQHRQLLQLLLFLSSTLLSLSSPFSFLPSPLFPSYSFLRLLVAWLGLAYKPRLLKIANTFANVARTLAGQSFLIAVYAYE